MQKESKFIQSIKTFLDFHVEQSGNQKKLAEQCGVSPANISRWLSKDSEKGRIPRMEDFAPIMDHFGITLDPKGISCSVCPRCKELEDENKILKAKNEAYLEAISAQAAAQSKVEIDQRPQLQALASGHAS